MLKRTHTRLLAVYEKMVEALRDERAATRQALASLQTQLDQALAREYEMREDLRAATGLKPRVAAHVNPVEVGASEPLLRAAVPISGSTPRALQRSAEQHLAAEWAKNEMKQLSTALNAAPR